MSENSKNLKEAENKAKAADFSDLIDKIENIDTKTKQLYKEIYTNAITDRTNAEVLLETLIAIATENSTEHAVHGKNMATYIERMTKSNAQLLQLATLINEATKVSEENMDPETLYEHIRNNRMSQQ